MLENESNEIMHSLVIINYHRAKYTIYYYWHQQWWWISEWCRTSPNTVQRLSTNAENDA